MSTERLTGKVRWFNASRGFGFIQGPDGKDVFLHYSCIKMDGYRTLAADEVVTYTLGNGPSGKIQAMDVEKESK
jgi:CspA family cold shock protein